MIIRPVLSHFFEWDTPVPMETGQRTHLYPFDTFEYEDPEEMPWRTGIELFPGPGGFAIGFTRQEGGFRPEAFLPDSRQHIELPEPPLSLLLRKDQRLYLLSGAGLELSKGKEWQRIPGKFGTDLIPAGPEHTWLVDRMDRKAQVLSEGKEASEPFSFPANGRPVAFPENWLAGIHPGPEEGIALLSPEGEIRIEVPEGLDLFSQPLAKKGREIQTAFGSRLIAYRDYAVFPGPNIQGAGLFEDGTPFLSGRFGSIVKLWTSDLAEPLNFEMPLDADNVRPYFVYRRDDSYYYIRGRGMILRFKHDGTFVDFIGTDRKQIDEEVFPWLWEMGKIQADQDGTLFLPISGAKGFGLLRLEAELRSGEA